MKNKLVPFLFVTSLIIGCASEEEGFKATGVFEAEEIILSAQAQGEILSLDVNEGSNVMDGQLIALLDSTSLELSKKVLLANKEVIQAQMPNVSVQIEATRQEITKQETERKRLKKLVAGDVATQKQLDDLNAYIAVLNAKLASQKSNLSISARTLLAKQEVVVAQLAQVDHEISHCKVTSPINGTVLLNYVKKGEFTTPGKPLMKLANLQQMTLKAYVTANQLMDLQIGQQVAVYAELGQEQSDPLTGTISWISSKAEFTPKTVQTQDERANLVYAVKVSIPNNGQLKIGMYGQFKLKE